MKSSETNRDHQRYGQADRSGRPARATSGSALRLPFGVAGVAALCGLALGLFGLFMPRAWLETIAFQMYLDRITSAALPPLGTTAQIMAAAAFALGGALFGWLIARLFGVQPSSLSFDSLINRLRGVGAGDEADAPSLRAADRHPDAPARRPFSAARDIARPDDEMDDDDDALLLDTQFASEHDAPPPPPLGATSGTSFDDHWHQANNVPQSPEMPQSSGLVDEDWSVTLPAPSLDDWERQPAQQPAPAPVAAFPPVAPVAQPVMTPRPPLVNAGPVVDPFAPPSPVAAVQSPALPPAMAAPPIASPAPTPTPVPIADVPASPVRASLPPVEPLDLSAARLDDLLARLETGLGRRHGLVPTAPPAAAVAGFDVAASTNAAERVDPVQPFAPQVAQAVPSQSFATSRPAPRDEPQDPAYPQDPALAAALRTLRRMNQQATA